MNDTPNKLSQNFTGTAPKADIRPPAIQDIRGGGKTFRWTGLAAEYYGIMRFMGYTAGVISDIFLDKQKEKRGAEIDKLKDAVESAKLTKVDANIHKASENLRKFERTKPRITKDFVSRVEFFFFAGLTALYAYRDWKDMRRAFSGSLAAENGMAPSSVTSGHMWNSDNPIIQTAMKRFSYMQISRLGSDATFLHSLNAGLIGMAARITVERTLFSQKTSYDLLEKLYQDTQNFNFNLHSPHKIAHEFANLVQAIQRDHERLPWPKETVEHYMPFFEAMAKGTAEKKIAINEAIYIYGELMTKRLTLDDSLKLVNDVMTHSLDGLRKLPKTMVLVSPAKQIAGEAVVVQESTDRQMEDLPKTMSHSNFTEKFMSNNVLSKSALEQGPRSFSQMAEQSADAVVRGV